MLSGMHSFHRQRRLERSRRWHEFLTGEGWLKGFWVAKPTMCTNGNLASLIPAPPFSGLSDPQGPLVLPDTWLVLGVEGTSIRS